MKQAENRVFFISEDGTIVRKQTGEFLKDKIEEMKKRMCRNGLNSQVNSPLSLLEKAREIIDISGKEDEAMSIFYRLDVQSLLSVDDCFKAGIYMFEKRNNINEAKNWYDLAIKKGGIEAKLRLAWLYRNGYGLSQNDIKALELFSECAACGNAIAEEEMGNIYFNGYLGVAINYDAAENMYRNSEVHGNKFIKHGSCYKKIESMKLLKKLSKKTFAMQIDNVSISNRGIRVTGKVSEGTVRVGDCVNIVGKKKIKETIISDCEIVDRTFKESHSEYTFPGDSVRLLLRGVDSKDVNIADWLKAVNR